MCALLRREPLVVHQSLLLLPLLLSCAHRPAESEPSAAERAARPGTGAALNVAAALPPCPADFTALSVTEVLADRRPRGQCLAVQGRLTASTSEVGKECVRLSDVEVPGYRDRSVCGGEWVLSNPRDPPPFRRDRSNGKSPSLIRLTTAGHYEPWVLPLQRCNRDDAGKPRLPASAAFELPQFEAADAVALNRDLSELTIGVFGGKNAREHDPDRLDSFNLMVVTHVCVVGGR